MSETHWSIEGECPECGSDRLATNGEHEWCMGCLYSSESEHDTMSETQEEYETKQDAFPQPLVQRYVSENGTDIQLIEDRPGGKEVAVVCSEYADLLGTAASAGRKAKEMGYDPQKAVEALPELISALDKLKTQASMLDVPATVKRYVNRVTENALASAEGAHNE